MRTLVVAFVLGAANVSAAQQPLETETARLPSRGAFALNVAYELQTSSQGTEHAIPVAFEYGLTNRLALLIEPVFYTSIRPKHGRGATGPGDLEVTVQWLTNYETNALPAVALAVEAKLPTARDTLIGTQHADVTPYLIASKRMGPIAVHANVGYSFVGKPRNVRVQNTVNFALAVTNQWSPRVELLAEVLSNTAAGADGTESTSAPEIAGAEQVGMLGFRVALSSRRFFSLGVTYDNTNALLLRPTLSFESPF